MNERDVVDEHETWEHEVYGCVISKWMPMMKFDDDSMMVNESMFVDHWAKVQWMIVWLIKIKMTVKMREREMEDHDQSFLDLDSDYHDNEHDLSSKSVPRVRGFP